MSSKSEIENPKPESLPKMDEFRKRLIATFKIEADEHLKAMSSGLIELEKRPALDERAEIIETVFRDAHSLKGAARAVNLTEIQSICQATENVFAALKRQELTLSPGLFDTLHETVDHLQKYLASVTAEGSAGGKIPIAALIGKLDSALSGSSPPARREESGTPNATKAEASPRIEPEAGLLHGETEEHKPVSTEKPFSTETIRIPVARLDALFLQAEELISAKLLTSRRAADLREIGTAFAAWNREWNRITPEVRTIRRWIENPDEEGPAANNRHMSRLFEFLDWSSTFIKSSESILASLVKSADQDRRWLASAVDQLMEGTKKALMMPFSSLLEAFPKFVRDLSRDQGKEVELIIRGGEIESDRRILEEMKDPLMHLVRNSIDHGIEKPEERTGKGKSPRGALTIAISPCEGGKAEICVDDDGAGINTALVRDTARRIGVITADEAAAMNERDAQQLVFRSGVSTSPVITDISGRGLGLAIVREKAENLGGVVSLETRPDKGAAFRMILPLSLATFRGIQVLVDEQLFVLPTANVERVMRVNRADIQTIENKETIQVYGQTVSLVRLSDVLEMRKNNATPQALERAHVVVAGSAEKRMAFLVDEIVSEEEVLVKGLGNQLSRVRNVAGATILGSGQVVPVLNVSDLMKSALKTGVAQTAAENGTQKTETEKKSVLVAEDSITARVLLKSILETAGYDVKTAVDGTDAFASLRTGDFDLLVSDVDMPRMNGLNLTAKIRADKKLADLPVILVTALGSREDRERGIEVGANAYIVKSSFDQSNLLEAVRRLI